MNDTYRKGTKGMQLPYSTLCTFLYSNYFPYEPPPEIF